jgi:hypothetical protein
MDGRKQAFIQFAALGLILGALAPRAFAAPSYTAILEWNGPYFSAINSPGLSQAVDSPVLQLPFQNAMAGVARYAADGRKVVYVVDSGNGRIQGFEANATYVYDSSDNFTFNGAGASAAHEWDADQILLQEWAASSGRWVVPGSEALVVNTESFDRVADVSFYSSADKVYSVDYSDVTGAPEILFPAGTLDANSTFEVRYLVTDYNGGGTAAFGLGDVDYGNAAGASVNTLLIDETTGGPTSFQMLRSLMVVPNEALATSDDLFVIDAADNSAGQNQELFVYTVTVAGVESFQEAYDDVLTSPADVYVASSAASSAATFANPGGGAAFWSAAGGAAITDASQINGHLYRATVASPNVTITDVTTGRVLVTAPFADLADPLLIVPGFSADLPALIPADAAYDLQTTGAVVNRYAFVTDAGANRIKVVGVGNFAWAGDWLPGDAKTMVVLPSGAGTVGAAADEEYDLTTPGTVPANWSTWTLASPVKEGSLDSITFDPDGTPVAWTRVDNILTGGPADRFFELDWQTGRITFGDGIHGQLPPAATDLRFSYATTPDALRYGTTGSGAGQFSSPQGIAARWNSALGYFDVYVADAANDRIQKLAFHPENPALQLPAWMEHRVDWNTAASASDNLSSPWDVDVENDGSGAVYLAVADRNNDRVVMYIDAAATQVGSPVAPSYSSSFGTSGNSLGMYNQIDGVDLADNGLVLDVYVADGSRDKVTKYEAAPVPTITLVLTGGSILPKSFPPSSSYPFTFTTTNAPEEGWVDFYFDTESTFSEASALLAITAGSVFPDAGTVTWKFSDSPGGTPADGDYFIFAVLRDATGSAVASDQTVAGQELTIDSSLTTAVEVRDQKDHDKTLLLQNGMERTVQLQLVFPDSIIGASFAGTFDPEYMEIAGITPGNAWDGTGFTDLLFNSAYDNEAGTYFVSATAVGTPTGLTDPGPKVAAQVRMRAKGTAVTETTRVRSGQMTLDAAGSSLIDIHGQEPAQWNLNALDTKVAYLGDLWDTSPVDPDDLPSLQPRPDGYISFDDQLVFTLGWNGVGGVQDPIADIGPATGTAPDLIPAGDGFLNVDDLLSFSSQFSWFAVKGFTNPQGIGGGGVADFLPLGEPVDSAVGVDLAASGEISEPVRTVDVAVTGAENLMGAMVRLRYDDRRMEFLSAAEGELLSRGGGYVMFHEIERPGAVEIDASRFHRAEPGVSGDGTVARLRFRMLQGTEVSISLAYDLRDSRNQVLARGERAAGTETAGPDRVALYRSAPNPAHPSTRITFALPKAGGARLAVYDISGRQVRLLADGIHEAGFHTVPWDGRDGRGQTLASGVYFYKLDASGTTQTRKLLVTQ